MSFRSPGAPAAGAGRQREPRGRALAGAAGPSTRRETLTNQIRVTSHCGCVATAHLIHGFVGAGKTTFAKRLAAETGAIRLSMDEWYLRLYTGGEPTESQEPELLRRVS